jgi:hypothetical protein
LLERCWSGPCPRLLERAMPANLLRLMLERAMPAILLKARMNLSNRGHGPLQHPLLQENKNV